MARDLGVASPLLLQTLRRHVCQPQAAIQRNKKTPNLRKDAFMGTVPEMDEWIHRWLVSVQMQPSTLVHATCCGDTCQGSNVVRGIRHVYPLYQVLKG